MRKVFYIPATLIIACYLLLGRGQWYSELERQAEIGSHPQYSDVVDINKPHTFTWKIAEADWSQGPGEAEVSIVFERVGAVPFEKYRKEGMPLKLKIDAYGVGKNGLRASRLIKNWYFTTNEPLSEEAKLWQAFGRQNIEYGLGGVNVYPFEDLFIELTILEPDKSLSVARPKLKIVGKHDHAVYGHITMLRFIRDGGLVLCILLLLSMTVLAWRK